MSTTEVSEVDDAEWALFDGFVAMHAEDWGVYTWTLDP